MGSLSACTMDNWNYFSHSPFSLEQFICISANHPGCRNIHWEMQVQTQWRCAQGTQIQGLACGHSFSILVLCWRTYHKSELVFAVFWSPAHPWMQGERQGSGSPGEQCWSWFSQPLGSGCSVWQWCWYMKHMWGQCSAHVACFAHCFVIFSFLRDKREEGDKLFRGWEIIFVLCNSGGETGPVLSVFVPNTALS